MKSGEYIDEIVLRNPPANNRRYSASTEVDGGHVVLVNSDSELPLGQDREISPDR